MADQLVLADYAVGLMADAVAEVMGGGILDIDLYTNDAAPSKSSILADFSVATFSGYAQQHTAFPIVAGVSGHVVSYAPVTVTFNHTPGTDEGNVYGYIVKWDLAGTLLFAAARFTGAPINISALLTSLAVAIVFTQESKYG